MAKLTAKARNALPAKDFALPGKRAYPTNDKPHARAAKSRASEMEHKGRISKSTEKKIDAKADKELGKGKAKKADPKPKRKDPDHDGDSHGLNHPHDRMEARKIANGFIVKHSTHHPDHGYMESEYYSEEAPAMKVPKSKGTVAE